MTCCCCCCCCCCCYQRLFYCGVVCDRRYLLRQQKRYLFTDGSTNGWMHRRMNGGLMVGWTEARTDGSTDGQTGGQKDGWTDGWMYKASGKRSVVRMKIVFTSYTVALTALTIISVLESGANIFLPSFYNSLNRLRGNRTSKKLNLFFSDNRTQ